MDQTELVSYLLNKIEQDMEIARSGFGIFITIDQPLTGKIHLSNAAKRAIDNFRQTKKLLDQNEIYVRVTVTASYEDIILTNDFPNSVSIDNSHGNSVTVKSAYSEKKMDFSMYGGTVKRLDIAAVVHSVYVSDLEYCAKLQIKDQGFKNESNLTFEGHFDYVRVISFLGNSLTIKLTRNAQNSQEETHFHLREIDSKSLFIQSDSNCKVDIINGRIDDIYLDLNCDVSDLVLKFLDCFRLKITLKNVLREFLVERIDLLKKLIISSRDTKRPATISSLVLYNLSFEKDFVGRISEISVNDKLHLEKVFNRGELIFESVSLLKKPLIVINSVLGKTAFFNSSISKTLSFESSNIEDVQFFNSEIPVKVMSHGNYGDKAIKNEREGIRQLKSAAGKRGDKELYNLLRSEELELHYKSIRWRFGNLSEKIALFLNKSNNHGQNWVKTGLIMLVTAAMLYSLFIWTIGYVLSLETGAFKTAYNLWMHFPDFAIPGYLYPTKTKFDFLRDLGICEFSKLHFVSKLLIYVNDILVIPYLTIQMITAFRKHASKE